MSDDDPSLSDAVAARFGAPLAEEPSLSAPERASLHRLMNRRACRAFEDRPVDEALVRAILAAGLSAPTKSDLQQADIIWVRDRALQAQLAEGLPGADWMATAPAFFTICANGARFASLFQDQTSSNGRFANDHFDALFNASVDAAIVLQGMIAAAALVGLGACPLSVLRNKSAEISQLLGLPDRVFVVAGLAMGWPAKQAPISPRLDLDATVHIDRFDPDASARAAPRYDARRAAEAPYRYQRDPDRFGTVDLYGWTEDKRRQYADPQRADFGAFLRGKGFSME